MFIVSIVLISILSSLSSSAIRIPFIRDVIFKSLSLANSTTIIQHTCNQCLCMASSSSSLLLNCLPNDTCQFFANFSSRYKLQSMTNARLYFLQGIFPNASQCCMPNTTDLVNKLRNATSIYGQVANPRCLVLDNHGYLVTLSTLGALFRFDPTSMTLIDQTSILSNSPWALTYFDGHYYVGLTNGIDIINSDDLTTCNHLTAAHLQETRDMIFLNHGDTLVVTSTYNGYLLFFNRSNSTPPNYVIAYEQTVNYSGPHGLFRINDTYFYTTSWAYNTVYLYSAIPGSAGWKEDLFLDARSTAPVSEGSHITMDECGRFWYSLGIYGVQIYDNQGSLLDTLTFTNSSIFDTMITDNYIIYLSDNGLNQVTRIDPKIEC